MGSFKLSEAYRIRQSSSASFPLDTKVKPDNEMAIKCYEVEEEPKDIPQIPFAIDGTEAGDCLSRL